MTGAEGSQPFACPDHRWTDPDPRRGGLHHPNLQCVLFVVQTRARGREMTVSAIMPDSDPLFGLP